MLLFSVLRQYIIGKIINKRKDFIMNNNIPRCEYPRPQFVRNSYVNLNGTAWTYQIDYTRTGMEREIYKSTGFDSVINVPFCPESKLSGVEHIDFIEEMYYHREITIPAEWAEKKILLHFGAVDYECWGFINLIFHFKLHLLF